MVKGLSHALKGIGGNYEINRLIGGIGGIVFIIGVHVFVGYEVFYLGKEFDLVTYCFAFPGGIAGIAGGTAGAVALKDRNVASARVIQETGSVPAKPPECPEPQPAAPTGPMGPTMQNREVDLAP